MQAWIRACKPAPWDEGPFCRPEIRGQSVRFKTCHAPGLKKPETRMLFCNMRNFRA
jgi:hypothetical protein